MISEIVWKRNGYSVIVWAVYLLGSSAALFYHTYHLAAKTAGEKQAVIAAVCLLLFVCGLSVAVHWCIKRIYWRVNHQTDRMLSEEELEERKDRRKLCEALLEGILFVLLLAGGVLLRGIAFPILEGNSPFYQQVR